MIPSTSVLASFKVTGGGGGGGGGGVAASIDDRTVTKTNLSGAPATASYSLDSNGNVYNHAGTNLEVWLDSGVNSNFECRATLVSGDALTTGTTGSWLALTSDRTWSLTATGEEKSTTLTIEIRNASTLSVLDSASIVLNALSQVE